MPNMFIYCDLSEKIYFPRQPPWKMADILNLLEANLPSPPKFQSSCISMWNIKLSGALYTVDTNSIHISIRGTNNLMFLWTSPQASTQNDSEESGEQVSFSMLKINKKLLDGRRGKDKKGQPRFCDAIPEGGSTCSFLMKFSSHHCFWKV